MQRIAVSGSRKLEDDQRKPMEAYMDKLIDWAAEQEESPTLICGDNPQGVDALFLLVLSEKNQSLLEEGQPALNYEIWGVGQPRMDGHPERDKYMKEAQASGHYQNAHALFPGEDWSHDQWTLRDQLMLETADVSRHLMNEQYRANGTPSGTWAGFSYTEQIGIPSRLLDFRTDPPTEHRHPALNPADPIINTPDDSIQYQFHTLPTQQGNNALVSYKHWQDTDGQPKHGYEIIDIANTTDLLAADSEHLNQLIAEQKTDQAMHIAYRQWLNNPTGKQRTPDSFHAEGPPDHFQVDTPNSDWQPSRNPSETTLWVNVENDPVYYGVRCIDDIVQVGKSWQTERGLHAERWQDLVRVSPDQDTEHELKKADRLLDNVGSGLIQIQNQWTHSEFGAGRSSEELLPEGPDNALRIALGTGMPTPATDSTQYTFSVLHTSDGQHTVSSDKIWFADNCKHINHEPLISEPDATKANSIRAHLSYLQEHDLNEAMSAAYGYWANNPTERQQRPMDSFHANGPEDTFLVANPEKTWQPPDLGEWWPGDQPNTFHNIYSCWSRDHQPLVVIDSTLPNERGMGVYSSEIIQFCQDEQDADRTANSLRFMLEKDPVSAMARTRQLWQATHNQDEVQQQQEMDL